MASKVDLRPCPFCGGGDIRAIDCISAETATEFHYVACQKCGNRTGYFQGVYATERAAAEAWNRRCEDDK